MSADSPERARLSYASGGNLPFAAPGTDNRTADKVSIRCGRANVGLDQLGQEPGNPMLSA
ncbi:hypothetical protein [Phaeobacter gallaeciensis]|uniref:hypothetical protein n=1 Tax=Phaeobacter gallaeciensis TaxID=60890 RepID=UPI0011BF2CB2|nr:hypothetical protein [Phaeobacter gallaeciensis]